MRERFNYKTLGEDQTHQVINAYENTRSCLRASMEEGVFVSPATVSRVINAALEVGEINLEIKRESGRPRDKREKAKQIINVFPKNRGYKVREQAAVVGCTTSTVYRALNEMNDLR